MKKMILFLILFCPVTLYAQAGAPLDPSVISLHTGSLPVQYHWDNVPLENISDKITRRYIMGASSMVVMWDFKKGAVVPMHAHANEQITWITKGSVRVTSQGKTFIVKAGDIILIPAYVPHKFEALEDTVDIDYFTGIREDWLNGTATYLPKS